MKQLIIAAMFISSASLFSCGSGGGDTKDSKEVADEKNEQKFQKSESAEDKADFVSTAVASNYAELGLAKLAIDKSKNSGIKEIADKLEKEHTMFLNDLKSYASSQSISVPAEETPDAKEKAKSLAEEKNFDKEWCDYLISAHEKTIAKYESFQASTTDAILKNWLTETLPKVKMHLQMLQEQKEHLKS